MNAPNTPYRPVLTNAARPSTFAVQAVDETGAVRDTPIAGEHPLTLYVDKHELVTLMTLGAAPEALAIGYLRNQRLLQRIEDIVAVQVDWDVGAVVVKTRRGLADLEAKTKKRTTTSGCGQGTVFGDLMAEIEDVRLPAGATLSQATLYALLDRVRVHETIYKQAGAVHGCALATNEPGRSEILTFVEDVGRHNAVDAIAGQMWLDRIDGGDKIFYTTGRLTSEMVIKAAQMGIPVPRLPLGLDADGPRDRRKGRDHDDRPRDGQALPAVHRRRAVPRRARARAMTVRHADVTGVVLAGGQGRRMGGVDKGLGRDQRQADGRARARAPRSAGRRRPGQRQPEPRPLPRAGLPGGPGCGRRVRRAARRAARRHDAGHARAGRHRALRFAVPAVGSRRAAARRARRRRRAARRGEDLRSAASGVRAGAARCPARSRRLSRRRGRKIDAWYAALRVVEVGFDDEADAFRNINTADELAAAESK